MIGEAGVPAPRPPATSVAFGARRRPEDATEVRLPEWEGPLGLLLALVEARRLDVMSVPLGDLAEAYLDALATLDGDRGEYKLTMPPSGWAPDDPDALPLFEQG